MNQINYTFVIALLIIFTILILSSSVDAQFDNNRPSPWQRPYDCPSRGQYYDFPKRRCLFCPPGSACTNSTRYLCQPGTFSETVGQVECRVCLPGTYSKREESTGCLSCPAGTATRDFGSRSCTPCERGFFAPARSTECSMCEAGTHSDPNGGSPSCSKCPAGFDSPQGAYQCSPCSAGFYAPHTGIPQCLPCPGGTYVGSQASTRCYPCNCGFISGAGTVECVACPRHSYSNQQKTACIRCPVGFGTHHIAACTISECTLELRLDAPPESSPFSKYNTQSDEPQSSSSIIVEPSSLSAPTYYHIRDE